MNSHKIVISLALIIVLLVGVVGCSPQDAPVADPSPEPTAVPPTNTPVPTPPPGPEEIAREFYEWYVEYSEKANPLVDRAYRQSPLVTAGFVAEMDAAIEAMRAAGPGGADLILCAQDIPGDMRYGDAAVDGDKATAVVQQIWNPGTEFEQVRDLTVILRRVEGSWLIDEIVCPLPEAEGPLTPAQVVTNFYDWYLAYAQTANPLVDKAYHDSPYVTAGFAQRVDEIVAGFVGGGYDPFLCAQDVPERVEVDAVFMSDPTPGVLVRTTFPGHFFTVDLRSGSGGNWQISNVTCGNTPEGLARAFYTWYLAYIGDPATGEMRNPLVDGAYRHSGFLTDAFIQKVDETIAGFDQGGFDPFLLAQDVPTAVSLDPGYLPDTAIATLYFGPVQQPGSVKMLQVECVPESGHWLINDIVEARAPVGARPDWPTFIDDEYGFSFRYPDQWVIEELDAHAAGVPDDWPVVRMHQLMPPDIAEALAAQSRPPDPTAPVIVAPFQVDVLVGDEVALNRAYYMDQPAATAVFNDHEALVRRAGGSTVEYIFAHPYREEVWVIFIDWVGEFPGREEAARAVADVLTAVLMTLTFTP